jgi:formylmethanofuran dehydrogenase subunit E
MDRKERDASRRHKAMDKRESQSAAEDGVKCENCGELITAAVYCTLCDKTLCYDCDAMVEHAEAHSI